MLRTIKPILTYLCLCSFFDVLQSSNLDSSDSHANLLIKAFEENFVFNLPHSGDSNLKSVFDNLTQRDNNLKVDSNHLFRYLPSYKVANIPKTEPKKSQIKNFPSDNLLNQDHRFACKESLIGHDGRVERNTKEFPYTTCFTIKGNFYYNDSQKYGSCGTCYAIGPCQIITAAHNVFNYNLKSKLNDEPPSGKYKAWLQNPTIEINGVKCGVKMMAVPKGYLSEDPLTHTRNDFALLLLEDNRGYSSGWLGTADLSEEFLKGMKVDISGVAGDKVIHSKKSSAIYGEEGRIKNTSDGLLCYPINTFDGQSGSPIIFQIMDRYFSLGNHISGLMDFCSENKERYIPTNIKGKDSPSVPVNKPVKTLKEILCNKGISFSQTFNDKDDKIFDLIAQFISFEWKRYTISPEDIKGPYQPESSPWGVIPQSKDFNYFIEAYLNYKNGIKDDNMLLRLVFYYEIGFPFGKNKEISQRALNLIKDKSILNIEDNIDKVISLDRIIAMYRYAKMNYKIFNEDNKEELYKKNLKSLYSLCLSQKESEKDGSSKDNENDLDRPFYGDLPSYIWARNFIFEKICTKTALVFDTIEFYESCWKNRYTKIGYCYYLKMKASNPDVEPSTEYIRITPEKTEKKALLFSARHNRLGSASASDPHTSNLAHALFRGAIRKGHIEALKECGDFLFDIVKESTLDEQNKESILDKQNKFDKIHEAYFYLSYYKEILQDKLSNNKIQEIEGKKLFLLDLLNREYKEKTKILEAHPLEKYKEDRDILKRRHYRKKSINSTASQSSLPQTMEANPINIPLPEMGRPRSSSNSVEVTRSKSEESHSQISKPLTSNRFAKTDPKPASKAHHSQGTKKSKGETKKKRSKRSKKN